MTNDLMPETVREIGDAVRSARELGEAIYPVGGRTLLHVGLPPSRKGTIVDLRRLDKVIDYPARDMTVTVQAGITVARLGQVLRGEGQRLPVDVPQAEAATLGGALAVNVSGPRRFGCGTFRDYVIGIRMVNDQGEEFKAGGRVVKNVAGYDICKLAIGSLGTLGIITEVTLKVRPLAEDQALAVIPCPVDPEPVLERLHRTGTQPVCIDLLNAAAVHWINHRVTSPFADRAWLVVVGYEHNHAAVAWQLDQLQREFAEEIDVCRTGAATELWESLVELTSGVGGNLQFKANLLSRNVVGFCKQAQELLPDVILQSHAGNGIVLGCLDVVPSLEGAAQILTTLRQSAVTGQGNLVLLRCPEEWKKALAVWGSPRDDLALMRAVKNKLDPHGIFNPGRFVDGI